MVTPVLSIPVPYLWLRSATWFCLFSSLPPWHRVSEKPRDDRADLQPRDSPPDRGCAGKGPGGRDSQAGAGGLKEGVRSRNQGTDVSWFTCCLSTLRGNVGVTGWAPSMHTSGRRHALGQGLLVYVFTLMSAHFHSAPGSSQEQLTALLTDRWSLCTADRQRSDYDVPENVLKTVTVEGWSEMRDAWTHKLINTAKALSAPS